MDASSPRIMAFGDTAITGGSHAPTPSYPRPQAGLPPRRAASASPPPVQGLQAQDLGPDPLVAVAGRRGPDHLVVRRLPTPPRRPLRRDGAPGPLGHTARLRRPATTAQRRAGRAPAQGAVPAPPEAGHRPDLDPLPRPAVPRPQRDLPRPGQGRHQPFPRLRHRLHHPQGAAVHRGPDRGHEGRGAQGRGPTPAPSGRPRGHPGPAAPAGSWVLQRGGGPLPPGGAGPVPDAGCLPRPVPQAAWRPDRQLRVPDLDDERLVHPYPDRCEETDRDGVDRREVPQLPGSVEAARAAGPDLRLLGLSAEVAGVGLRDVPAAVRDRVELPSDARGADPDLEPSSRGAAVVRGDRAGAAEPLGVAALRAPVAAVSWRPGDPAGAAAMGDAAAVAAPHGRG